MSGHRVLVTRSEPGASATAERLAAKGYQPLVEPLFRLEAIPALFPLFDALAFTSLNGVRSFAALSTRRDVPVFCVGGRTAETAREHGFTDVASADSDVEALLKLLLDKLPPAARLLHAGNEDSRGDLAGRLQAAGRQAEFVPTFRAIAVQTPGPLLYDHLFGRPAFDAVLIHSPRGAAILAGFCRQWPARAPIRAAAISDAAAQPLSRLAEQVEVALTPGEDALIDALGRLLA